MTKDAALKALRQHKRALTAQQMRTVKGQILSGDIGGAMRGLKRLTQTASAGDNPNE